MEVSRLLNRELSTLDWNERVLELAHDESLPLLERVKFAAIFSSNLDEFFQVRVAGLMGQTESGMNVVLPDGHTPAQTLGEVRQRTLGLVARQSKLWQRDLCPALAKQGISIVPVDELAAKDRQELVARFEREIYPVLTPLAVGPGQPFPYISPLSLSLGVFVRDPDSGEERFARVKVPERMPRFVQIGKQPALVPLEGIVAHFLERLFPSMEIVEHAFFRVTRDADFEVSDEADDLLEAVELELRRRRFGDVIRLEVSSEMSKGMLERLKTGLGVDSEQVYAIDGLLDLSEVMQIAHLDRPDLKDAPWVPAVPARFAARSDGDGWDPFSEIRRADVLVHHPYESFAGSYAAFIRAAARDPDVIGLKTTVYRTSDESPVVPALVEAAEYGKQAVCLVELKARFDERRNIEWSRALERAGVHVVYGFTNLKAHMKATLVLRREGDVIRRYAHIGTGNYHAVTARLYEDFGLFTADPEITADLAALFNHLTGFGKPEEFRRVLVAPYNLRQRLIEEIRDVAAAARSGEQARILFKVNNLTHPAVCEELYAASQAGVRVDLLVRSICAIRPGVKGLSEGIRARSVLGRFLEHSRVFVFVRGGAQRVFMGSADLMPRNLDTRLELVVPVEDPRLRTRLVSALETTWEDTQWAWELRPDGKWQRVKPKKGERVRASQTTLMRLAARRRRQPAPRRVKV